MSTPKTILYIHHGKGIGGAALSLLYLVSNLDRSRYQPLVLFLHQSPAIALFQARGIPICGPVNVGDFSHTKIWWFAWYHVPYLLRAASDTMQTIAYVARRWLRIIRPDMVHLNTSTLIGWGMVAKRMGIPVVWHIREPLAPGYLGLRRWLVKTCIARFADLILPICKHDAAPWKKLAKTHVVYNAVEATTFNAALCTQQFAEQHNLNPTKKYILFVGGISVQKGTLTILKAMELLLTKMPDVCLLIAGDTSQLEPGRWFKRHFPTDQHRTKVRVLLDKLGSSIRLLGTITTIPEAMAFAHVIVFPAPVGHFARPVIEAGFMHKPVVASACPPLDELVQHGTTGLLVPPHAIAAWANALESILSNQEYAKQLGESAYTFCMQRFSIEQQVELVQAHYDNLFALQQAETA